MKSSVLFATISLFLAISVASAEEKPSTNPVSVPQSVILRLPSVPGWTDVQPATLGTAFGSAARLNIGADASLIVFVESMGNKTPRYSAEAISEAMVSNEWEMGEVVRTPDNMTAQVTARFEEMRGKVVVRDAQDGLPVRVAYVCKWDKGVKTPDPAVTSAECDKLAFGTQVMSPPAAPKKK